jgi:two-component system nitrogen regulation sensor histidine kinase NtrY
VLEDHGGRIELKDASDFRPGQRGAWMRLRFAVSGQAPKADGKEHAGATKVEEGETKPPSSGTNEAASTTNDETKIEAATGN